jgi:hypothetical protein
MSVTTSIARHYAIKHIVLIVVSIAFALWGAYDLWGKLPREQQVADDYAEFTAEKEQLEFELGEGTVSEARRAEATERYEELEARLKKLAPDAETPVPPEAFDRLVCWIFISCVLCVPWFYWQYRVAKKRVYTLDDDGTFTAPEGTWTAAQLADIDMSRWMAKSLAWVVAEDGTRVKLDDYIHRDSAGIVGRLAVRFHPDEWTEEAKPVAVEEPEEPQQPE